MEVTIQELAEAKVAGLSWHSIDDCTPWNETYFRWTAMPLSVDFAQNNITCGMLTGWHHTPVFDVLEYHADKELFYFISGTALLLLCDIKNGVPDLKTAQMVRVPAGTELSIDAGKGHFVAVAEGERYDAIVIAPAQEAPRVALPEQIIGKRA